MKVLAPYYEQIRMLKELDDIAAKDDPRQLSDSEWPLMQGTQDRGFAVSQMAQGYVQDLEYRNLADVIARLRNGTGGRLFGSAPKWRPAATAGRGSIRAWGLGAKYGAVGAFICRAALYGQ
jgi:hypothetical protein